MDDVIRIFEKVKFKNNTDEKLLETRKCNFGVRTSDGSHTAVEVHRTREFEVYSLETENNHAIDCADSHLVYSSRNFTESWKHVSELTQDDYVLTDTGWSRVTSVVP